MLSRETARISWQELQPFFARGALLRVAPGEDLVAIAEGLAEDDRERVAAWLATGALCKVEAEHAQAGALDQRQQLGLAGASRQAWSVSAKTL